MSLKCIDWLGLNTRSIPAEAKKEIYVCPKQRSRECRTGNGKDPFCSHDKLFPSAWKEREIRGLREYIQGGPLNRIHWKMSAKTGTLQMIEYENMAEKSLFLLPDFAGADGETADQILENLFSLSRSFIEEGKTHWIGMISDGKLAKFYVNNIESCQTALYQMLRLPYDRKEGAADFYKRVLEKENIRVEMITALSGTGL